MQMQPHGTTRPLAQPRTLAVFASAERGLLPAYEQAAGELGALLADLPVRLLVEGAGSRGVLGAVVAPVLAAGLPVVQVVTGQLGGDWQPSQHWRVVDRRQGRQRMVAEADVLLFLPGGPECCLALLETLQAQQDERSVPILLCNTAQFFLPLLTLLTHLEGSGFLPSDWRQRIWEGERPRALLARFSQLPSRQAFPGQRAAALHELSPLPPCTAVPHLRQEPQHASKEDSSAPFTPGRGPGA